MTIRKRFTSNNEEKQINDVIHKGGSVGSEVNPISSSNYRLTLRIPNPLKTKVEETIKQDPACPSLTSWILEAMKQRLQNEKNKDKF